MLTRIGVFIFSLDEKTNQKNQGKRRLSRRTSLFAYIGSAETNRALCWLVRHLLAQYYKQTVCSSFKHMRLPTIFIIYITKLHYAENACLS